MSSDKVDKVDLRRKLIVAKTVAKIFADVAEMWSIKCKIMKLGEDGGAVGTAQKTGRNPHKPLCNRPLAEGVGEAAAELEEAHADKAAAEAETAALTELQSTLDNRRREYQDLQGHILVLTRASADLGQVISTGMEKLLEGLDAHHAAMGRVEDATSKIVNAITAKIERDGQPSSPWKLPSTTSKLPMQSMQHKPAYMLRSAAPCKLPSHAAQARAINAEADKQVREERVARLTAELRQAQDALDGKHSARQSPPNPDELVCRLSWTEQSRGFSEELSAKQDALAGAQKEVLQAGMSAMIPREEQTRRHFAERSSMPAALADAQAQLLQAGTSAIKAQARMHSVELLAKQDEPAAAQARIVQAENTITEAQEQIALTMGQDQQRRAAAAQHPRHRREA
eukprot:jgi/Tetstr1/446727/TSEL_034215.t1